MSDLGDQLVGSLEFLGSNVELIFGKRGEVTDLVADLTHVRRRVGNVAGTSFTLGANHCCTFGNATERFTQVGCTADEGNGEVPLVDVVGVIGRGENLGFVDVVDAEGLQDLSLNEVADASLCHNRDRDSVDDAIDQIRVRHTCNATLCANVSRNALKRHDGNCARIFGDLCLLGSNDVHDDAALEHLSHTALNLRGTNFAS